MALSDVAIRNARPAPKPVRHFDGGGLYLEVSPSGGKLWRFKYRFGGKEKRLGFGIYPDVSLADAREQRDLARKLLAKDIDPGEHRKVQKAAKAERATNSFETVAREWFAKYSPKWATSHSDKIIRRLEMDVFPWIGGDPIAEITAPAVLKVLRRIEGRGALDTAHRAQQNCGQIFRYGVATGRLDVIRSPTFEAPSLPHSTFTFHPSLNRRKSASCFAQLMAFEEHLLFNVPFDWRPCCLRVLGNCEKQCGRKSTCTRESGAIW